MVELRILPGGRQRNKRKLCEKGKKVCSQMTSAVRRYTLFPLHLTFQFAYSRFIRRKKQSLSSAMFDILEESLLPRQVCIENDYLTLANHTIPRCTRGFCSRHLSLELANDSNHQRRLRANCHPEIEDSCGTPTLSGRTSSLTARHLLPVKQRCGPPLASTHSDNRWARIRSTHAFAAAPTEYRTGRIATNYTACK